MRAGRRVIGTSVMATISAPGEESIATMIVDSAGIAVVDKYTHRKLYAASVTMDSLKYGCLKRLPMFNVTN